MVNGNFYILCSLYDFYVYFTFATCRQQLLPAHILNAVNFMKLFAKIFFSYCKYDSWL